MNHALQEWPDHVRVAIIGTGFGGLGAGVTLAEAGISDFVLLERADAVGGTWRDNTYPGCACDVPSHLYSFSFAPNREWTHSFSRQAEIRQYLEGIADKYGLREHIQFRANVTEARWDAEARCWRLDTTRGSLRADMVISAAGPLADPRLPDVPGLAEFPGSVFHSARWNHGVDLAGKRVAVIGTGASAIQIVPELQPLVSQLVLFQRTPAWILPRFDREFSSRERWVYRHFPAAGRMARFGIYAVRECYVPAFTKQPNLLKAAQIFAQRNLAGQVPDKGLRAKLTPTYVMGCKRVLISSDFYPAVARENVAVVASGLA
ncbi:MAG: flavin-containing monooxygenase, partial [Streptosporangiaceae bacterium]